MGTYTFLSLSRLTNKLYNSVDSPPFSVACEGITYGRALYLPGPSKLAASFRKGTYGKWLHKSTLIPRAYRAPEGLIIPTNISL